MNRFLLVGFLILFSFSGIAQNYMPKGGRYGGKKTKYRQRSTSLKRNPTDVFPLDPDYRLNGWFAAVGGTYMIPMKKGEGDFYANQQFNDTTLETFSNYTSDPSGKLGFYAEAGWFHSFENPSFFHFLDIGLSYKQFKGGESFSGQYWSVATDSLGNSFESPKTNVTSDDTYSDQLLSLVANVTHHYHFSRYGFIQNTLGMNVDYFFSTSRSTGPSFAGYKAEFPEQFMAQLHYRLGVGWRATPSLLIIPSVEVPLVSADVSGNVSFSLPYFTTGHYPILFSIRFMFLRKISEDCVVPSYDGPSNFD